MTGRELLLGNSRHFAGGERRGGAPAFAAWGQVATGGFEADVDDVRMGGDGDVPTGLIGLEAEWERMLAGLALSQSTGEGSYTLSGALPTPTRVLLDRPTNGMRFCAERPMDVPNPPLTPPAQRGRPGAPSESSGVPGRTT